MIVDACDCIYLCVTHSRSYFRTPQNLVLAIVNTAHNAALGEWEQSYGVDCEVRIEHWRTQLERWR